MAASHSPHLFFVILMNCFPFCLVRAWRLTFYSFPRNFYFSHFHVASNAKSYFLVAVAVVAYSRLSIGREVRNCGERAKKWTKDWGHPPLDLFLSRFFLRPVHTTWEPGTGYRRRSCVSTLNKGEWWILAPKNERSLCRNETKCHMNKNFTETPTFSEKMKKVSVIKLIKVTEILKAAITVISGFNTKARLMHWPSASLVCSCKLFPQAHQ